MNPDTSLKPPAETFILDPCVLGIHIMAMQEAFARNRALIGADVREHLQPVMQHYLASNYSQAQVMKAVNGSVGVGFTRNTYIGYTTRWGLHVYNLPNANRTGTRKYGRRSPEEIAAREAERQANAIRKAEMAAARATAKAIAKASRKARSRRGRPTSWSPARRAHAVARQAAREVRPPEVVHQVTGNEVTFLNRLEGQCGDIVGYEAGMPICCGTPTFLLNQCRYHYGVNHNPSGRKKPVYVAEKLSNRLTLQIGSFA